MTTKTTRVLGLEFFAGTTLEAVRLARKGGLIVAPPGPCLATLVTDHQYRISLENADLILVDSGYLAILCRLFLHTRLTRISGLEFLETLLSDEHFRNSRKLWVDPSEEEGATNRRHLTRIGIRVTVDDSYVAPLYTPGLAKDEALLQRIRDDRPDYVIINIAGNKQEPLGHHLKQNLESPPALVCTGAAIAFLSGKQADIPRWADRLFLGWLARCFVNPGKFIPRYLRAVSLALLVAKYGRSGLPSAQMGESQDD